MAYNQKNNPFKKIKGGGTKKVCLPLAKIKRMSKSERNKVINAKRKAGSKGTVSYTHLTLPTKA